MGKMKETAPKGNKNRPSTALAKTAEDPAERAEREAAIMALANLGDAGYEEIVEQAEGEIQELDVVEKEMLKGVPLVVIDVKENVSKTNVDPDSGDYAKYLFVTVLTKVGVKAFTDGGSGIRGQIGALIGKIDPRDPKTFVKAPGGLKPSDPYPNSVNGNMTVTWRLAQHEKQEKTLSAAPRGNSRPQARA